MSYAMGKVLTEGSARESNNNTFPKVPMIGKTGTTDFAKDTWMSGASSNVATVVGVVSVTGERNQRNTYFDSGQAATARHRMWPDIMSLANAKYGGDEFAEADNSTISGAQIDVPDVRGDDVADATETLEDAGFQVIDGGIVDSELPEGTVAYTDPNDSQTASIGTDITVFTSNGNQLLLPDVVGDSEVNARGDLSEFNVVTRDEAVTDESEDGEVLSMTPEDGTAATKGSTVTLTIGRFEGANNGDNDNNGNNGNNEDDE